MSIETQALTRWTYDYLAAGEVEDEEGSYVLFADHQRVVEQLVLAISELIDVADNALRVNRGDGGTKPNAWSSLESAIARFKGERP